MSGCPNYLNELVRIGAIDYHIALPFLQQKDYGLSFAKQLVDNFSGSHEQLREIFFAICDMLWVELFHYVFKLFPMRKSFYSEYLEKLCSLHYYLWRKQDRYKQVQIAHMILSVDRFGYEDDHIKNCLRNHHFTLAKYIIDHGKHRTDRTKKRILSEMAYRLDFRFGRVIEFCFVNGFRDTRFCNDKSYLHNKHSLPHCRKGTYKHNIKLFNIIKYFLCKDVTTFTCRFVGFGKDIKNIGCESGDEDSGFDYSSDDHDERIR